MTGKKGQLRVCHTHTHTYTSIHRHFISQPIHYSSSPPHFLFSLMDIDIYWQKGAARRNPKKQEKRKELAKGERPFNREKWGEKIWLSSLPLSLFLACKTKWASLEVNLPNTTHRWMCAVLSLHLHLRICFISLGVQFWCKILVQSDKVHTRSKTQLVICFRDSKIKERERERERERTFCKEWTTVEVNCKCTYTFFFFFLLHCNTDQCI